MRQYVSSEPASLTQYNWSSALKVRAKRCVSGNWFSTQAGVTSLKCFESNLCCRCSCFFVCRSHVVLGRKKEGGRKRGVQKVSRIWALKVLSVQIVMSILVLRSTEWSNLGFLAQCSNWPSHSRRTQQFREKTDKLVVHACCVQGCEWERRESPSYIPLLAWMAQQHCTYLSNPAVRTTCFFWSEHHYSPIFPIEDEVSQPFLCLRSLHGLEQGQ